MRFDGNDILYLQEETQEKVHDWLVTLLYWLAWGRGSKAYPKYSKKKAGSTDGIVYMWDWGPDSSQLKYKWYIYYGHLYLQFINEEDTFISNFSISGKDLDTILVINRKDRDNLRARELVTLINKVDTLVQSFFMGIHQLNSVQICSSPIHSYNNPNCENDHQSTLYATICHEINKQWFCERCLNQFNLLDKGKKPSFRLQSQENEFKRLTPRLRLSVLQRDAFVCQKCKTGIDDNPEIILNVEYIKPIENGGKSRLENLSTICFECKNSQKE